MKIRIDLGTCVKSGQCCYLFPDFVRLAKDDFPQLVREEFAEDEKARVGELVDTCPAMAISLVDTVE